MPYYDYKCRDCEDTFTVKRSITIKAGNVVCPHCQSINTHQVFIKPPMTSIQGLPKDRFK